MWGALSPHIECMYMAVLNNSVCVLSRHHADAMQQCAANCSGSKGAIPEAADSEDEVVPFMGQDDRRPNQRARKTMQLQEVDAVLRDMRSDPHCSNLRPDLGFSP